MHIIDLIDDKDQIEKIQHIQKSVKYGLPSEESIHLYESGIKDRFVCQKILDNAYISSLGGDVNSFLERYPDWIRYKYNELATE